MIDQLAQVSTPETFKGLVGLFLNIINGLLFLLAGLSILVFFKGLAAFIFKAGDEKALADGKGLMTWGVVGFFVMVSLIGIMMFFYQTFGFEGVRSFGFPLLPQ